MKSTTKTASVAVLLSLVLSPGVVVAQFDNPWNPNAQQTVPAGSQYGQPSADVVNVQAQTSRYAPADLEQRLSVVKPPQPVMPVPAPNFPQPQARAIQPPAAPQSGPYTGQQQYTAPIANAYPNNGFAPGYGYGAPVQGFNGYQPGFGQGGYNNFGSGMPIGPGGYPGGIGGFLPSGGMVPGGGSSPFNFSPFGFF